MNTITIELTNSGSMEALRELEQLEMIRIKEESSLSSYALAGNPMSHEDFKNWIEFVEKSPFVSKTEAVQRWATQKKKLQSLIS